MPLTAKVERVDVVEGEGGSSLKARFSQFSGGQHAEYTLLVMADGNSSQLKKRFSDFAALHDALRARHSVSFDLPAKTPIRYFNPDKLEDRKNALNAYLKELCHRQDLTGSPECRRFFAADGQPPLPESSPAPAAPGGGYSGGNSAPAPRAEAPRASQSMNKPKSSGPRQDEDDDLVGWDN